MAACATIAVLRYRYASALHLDHHVEHALGAGAVGRQQHVDAANRARVKHRTHLREGQEAFVAMVVAHAAVTDTTERQAVHTDVQQAVVDGHATGHGVVDVPVGQLAVVGVGVERQRARVVVDVTGHFLAAAVGLDRQDRAEDLALHYVHVIGRVEHDMRRHDPAAGIRLLIGHQVDDGRALALGN